MLLSFLETVSYQRPIRARWNKHLHRAVLLLQCSELASPTRANNILWQIHSKLLSLQEKGAGLPAWGQQTKCSRRCLQGRCGRWVHFFSALPFDFQVTTVARDPFETNFDSNVFISRLVFLFPLPQYSLHSLTQPSSHVHFILFALTLVKNPQIIYAPQCLLLPPPPPQNYFFSPGLLDIFF